MRDPTFTGENLNMLPSSDAILVPQVGGKSRSRCEGCCTYAGKPEDYWGRAVY